MPVNVLFEDPVSERTTEHQFHNKKRWHKKRDTLPENVARTIRNSQRSAIRGAEPYGIADQRRVATVIEKAWPTGSKRVREQRIQQDRLRILQAMLSGQGAIDGRIIETIFRSVGDKVEISRPAIAAVLSALKSTAKMDELVEPASSLSGRSHFISFLHRAQRLEEAGHEAECLDIVYATIDDYLRGSKFAKVDEVLRNVAVDEFSVDLLLALLTATLPAGDRLKNRPEFFDRVAVSLNARGELDDTLLSGLEG